MGGRKKVFITGAAGNIGTVLRKRLRNRYDLRLLFHTRIPEDVGEEDEVLVSDVSDSEAMLRACSGVDAIVHLALAGPRRSSWTGPVPGPRPGPGCCRPGC